MSFNKPTFPGVYTRLVAEGPRTITGVSTSITVFVGKTIKGPFSPTHVFTWTEFEKIFGGLWIKSKMSYAVQDYFLNGGTEAVICRVFTKSSDDEVANRGGRTKFTFENGLPTLIVKDPGEWSLYNIEVQVDNILTDHQNHINLQILDKSSNKREIYRNVSLLGDDTNYIEKVLEASSSILRVDPDSRLSDVTFTNKFVIIYRHDLAEAAQDYKDKIGKNLLKSLQQSGAFADAGLSDLDDLQEDRYSDLITFLDEPSDNNQGNDGDTDLNDIDIMGDRTDTDGSNLLDDLDNTNEKVRMGLAALEEVDLFNILCIPPYNANDQTTKGVYDLAISICEKRRSFLIVDYNNTQRWNDPLRVTNQLPSPNKNSAVFFPRVKKKDPADEYRIKEFVPCGAVAGVMARTDANIGVWKAPAGYEAGIRGISGLALNLTDEQNGALNIKGINCLMSKPIIGPVVWGARTRRGADELADPWKYIPVIRTALFIEESLYRGTQWVPFEPNDEPLWSQIRLSIEDFMYNLFRRGAFQGTSSKEAYFVKCDKETTTEYDRNNGIVNIIVGFAPLKPAEFVLITIQQITEASQ